MREKNTPTDLEIEHWEAFINRFVHHERRKRWNTLVHMGYGHWSALPLADFIGYGTERQKEVVIEGIRGDELSGRLSEFGVAASHNCLLLDTGRGGSAGSKVLSLAECLSGEHWILEGLISIVPGKLALLFDHEGQISFCAVSPPGPYNHGSARNRSR